MISASFHKRNKIAFSFESGFHKNKPCTASSQYIKQFRTNNQFNTQRNSASLYKDLWYYLDIIWDIECIQEGREWNWITCKLL